MTWTYVSPASSVKDQVRFLISDTNSLDQKVSDEEINYSLSLYPDPSLAAAYVLRPVILRLEMYSYSGEGRAFADFRGIAKRLSELVNALDPGGVTTGGSSSVLPTFGGISLSKKQTIYSDPDAVQAYFTRDGFDE